MTVNITQTAAWQRGTAQAKADTAAITAKPPVPVTYTAAATSILASPHIKDWPVECREWLFDKCTTKPKSPGQHPHYAISRAELGLED